jgi:hypothetical protein
VTDRKKFEAGLGRLVLWVLVYGLLAGVAFIVAEWLLGVLGMNGLGRTAVGVLAAVVAGWLGANALERRWRRGAMADAPETPQRR